MKIYLLIFLAILGCTYCGEYERMLAFHFDYKNITCERNECSFYFDVRNKTYSAWKSVMIKVSLDYHNEVPNGKIEVYDLTPGEAILDSRNVFQGPILSFPRRSTATVGCSSRSCLYDICVARGYTNIFNNVHKNHNTKSTIEWEPIISFNNLIRGNGVGPRIKFRYETEKGQRTGKLKVSPTVNFWGECDKPHLAYPEDEGVNVPVGYYRLNVEK